MAAVTSSSSSSCCTSTVNVIDAHQLASVVKNRIENVLIIDSRSFIEYNVCHVATAVNVCSSKIVKRRLQQDKLSVKELLVHTCHCDVDDAFDVVIYDQQSKELDSLTPDSFTSILIAKLQNAFGSVNFLCGGITEFQNIYPELCGDKVRKAPPLTSLSQPCLPIADQGPTRILPFLYLGSQLDALNKDLLKDHDITYELNVSTTCPKPEFLPEGHFMRIPVNDNYSEKLLPYFPEAFNFLDKVREGSGCVLVHCLAGISRSPTIAIAYVMRYLRLTSDDGYRYVKSKRPTISPNFNFLGQLLEFEKQLRREEILDGKPEEHSAPPVAGKKRLCKTDMRTAKLSLTINTDQSRNVFAHTSKAGEQSPTTALAKLSFSGPPTPEAMFPAEGLHHSRSCESMLELTSLKESGSTGISVLSPVKEIKCESLISEISTGRSELLSSRSKSPGQWKFTRSCKSEKRETISSDNTSSSRSRSKFYVETTSCLSSSEVETKWHMQKKTGKRDCRFPFSFAEALWTSRETTNSEKQTARSKALNKPNVSEIFQCTTAVPESSSFLPAYLGSRSSYSRSDSTATSGFGSESSDWFEDNQTSKASDVTKIEFDVEDLDDDVILRSSLDPSSSKPLERCSDSAYFSLTLPDVSATEWSQGLQSPLSPSESHLLEDVISDTSSGFRHTEETNPSASEHYSVEDCEGIRTYCTPSRWQWSRKRVAAFDDSPSVEPSNHAVTFARDKRKYEPLSESVCLKGSRTKDLNEKCDLKSQELPPRKDFPEFVTPSDECCAKVGLYRVHSCPGISCPSLAEKTHFLCTFKAFRRTSSKDSGVERSFQRHSIREDDHFFVFPKKDIMCSESCPDVLHLDGSANSVQSMPSSPHHRDFRRNVRLISVS